MGFGNRIRTRDSYARGDIYVRNRVQDFATGFEYGIWERDSDTVVGLGIRIWESGTEYGREICVFGGTPMYAIGCGTFVRDSGTVFGYGVRIGD